MCGEPGAVVCRRCEVSLSAAPSMALPPFVEGCRALFDYADARRLVTSFKNGGRRDLAGWLADRMASGRWVPPGAVVTWAPTSGSRRRTRGFDHAELLARALARRLGLPCRSLLERRPGPAQSGRSATVRRHHPGFRATRLCPATVVVVDDVVTTGATLSSSAVALKAAGATCVLSCVIARAPLPAARERRDSAPAPA